MNQSESPIDLYSNQILSLAGSISLTERLKDPDSSATKRSPLCGSMVTVDLNITGNKIIAFGQEVRSCVLGQAAASILANEILGKNANQIYQTRSEVIKMLNGGKYSLDIFQDFNILSPAKDYKNRHASIMLALDATFECIQFIKG